MRKRLVIGGVVLVAAGGLTLGLLLAGDGAATQQPGVVATSAPLPDVRGTTLAGMPFSTSDYHGRILVLNFWNPYCAPCRKEATVLDLAQGGLGPKGVVIAGVLFSNTNFPHDVPAARRFARELGERYPTMDDPGGDIASAFGVPGIPTTIVADATGRIRYKVFGPLKKGELESLIRRLQQR
jgi:cytochrome c biogenesis protein CcmG/thiol:disulfide interchange protein DsbE